GGHRRIGIGDHFAEHRHDSATLGALQECVAGVHALNLAAMRWSAVLLLLLATPPAAADQDWNSDSALALARRAIERRAQTAVDTALRDYKAKAHGFLFFLGQFGEGLTEPPRLVKADQLELEVYWKAPQLSKQRIIGWRDRAELVGTLFVDVGSAELVRMAFNFTPTAYLDPQLEDVSIVLDNALWEGFWLPYRQEIEIRRRATWLDIPARGIIRGRWEIDSYVFNLGLATSWFQGDEIAFLPKAERDSFPWPEPLAQAIQGVAEPVRQNDLERV